MTSKEDGNFCSKEGIVVCGLLLRIVVNAVILYWMVEWLPEIFVDTFWCLLAASLAVGIANGLVRTILCKLRCPLSWRTLGGLTFLTNLLTPAALLKVLPGVQVSSLFLPFLSMGVVTLCSCLLSVYIQDR